MKRNLIKILVIFCLFGLLAQTVFMQCDITVGKGVSATKWNDEWTQDGPGKGLEPAGAPGWTGADSTISVKLPNGDSAFFFSDSFIGESPALPGDGRVYRNENGLRMRIPNCIPPICGSKPEHIHYVFNSIVVRSKDGKTLRTLVGEKDRNGYSTAFFKPKNKKNMFWLGDAFIKEVDGKKKVWVFLNEWDVSRPFDKDFRINFEGQSIAQLDADSLKLEKIVSLRNLVDEGVWGIAAWLDKSETDETLYIWGMRNTTEIKVKNPAAIDIVNRYKKLYVARTKKIKSIKDVANEKDWRAWDGRKWGKLKNAKSIIPDKDSISDELSIKRLNINGKPTFVMVSFDTSTGYGTWRDLYLYSACSPQGPFNNRKFFYRTPTSGKTKLDGMTVDQSLKSGLSVYNPHLHPQFTKDGELLVSYNSNLPFGAKPGDSIYADFYKPRFVRVKVEGLK